jgi:hypothetical protein
MESLTRAYLQSLAGPFQRWTGRQRPEFRRTGPGWQELEGRVAQAPPAGLEQHPADFQANFNTQSRELPEESLQAVRQPGDMYSEAGGSQAVSGIPSDDLPESSVQTEDEVSRRGSTGGPDSSRQSMGSNSNAISTQQYSNTEGTMTTDIDPAPEETDSANGSGCERCMIGCISFVGDCIKGMCCRF